MPELHTLTARLNTLANPGRQGEDILQGLDVSNLPRNFVSRLINDSMGNSEYRRIASLGELETRPANSSHCGSCCASIFCCYTSMLIQHGTLGVMREDADFHFLAPGYHCYPVCGREMGEPLALTKPNTPLNFGTCGMMTVAEGCVGVLLVGPHYKLLAPGIYQWSSPQVRVEGVHRLNAERVALGPFTLVTVPEGCVAVTFNNGALRVLGLPTTTTALVHDDDSTTSASMLNRPAAAAGNLPSNRTYFLDDPKWNCEGMLPTVVQTDRLEGNDLLSKDNVELLMVAMSEWRIVDPERAVTNCSPTMEGIRTKVNHLVRATIARIVAGTNIGAGPVSGSVAAPMVVATAVTGDPIDHCDKRPAPSKEELSHLMQSEQATRHMAHLGLQMAAMGVEVLGVYVPEKRIKNDDIRSQIANQAVIGIHAEAERASADATAYATVKAAKAQAEAISLLAHAHADAGMRLGGPDGTAARLALSESMTKALENSKVTIFTGAPNMLPFMFGSDPSQSSQDQQVSSSATAGKRRPIAAAME